MSLCFSNLSRDKAHRRVLNNLSGKIEAGTLTAIIGPNGAGKSTLLTAMAGLDGLGDGEEGEIRWNGTHLDPLTAAQRAEYLSYLPQSRDVAWPLSVSEVIALGRYSYGSSFDQLSGEDHAAIQRASEDADVTDLLSRAADTLSGGELARVLLARALAAERALLLLDEPLAALDIHHQLRVMENLRARSATGTTIVIVLHDLGLAARFADQLILLDQGNLIAQGPAPDILTTSRLAQTFGIVGDLKTVEGVTTLVVSAARHAARNG